MKDIGNLALMYLSETTTPEDTVVKDLDFKKEHGVLYAKFRIVLHSFHVLNRNKRLYDNKNTWDMIQLSEEIQDKMRRKCWYGEEDHPAPIYENMKLTAARVQKIEADRKAWTILNPYLTNNDTLLEAEVQSCAGSKYGDALTKELLQGLIPAASARSIARLVMRDGKPYVEIKKLITYDKVDFPSHREAIMVGKPTIYLPNGVVSESVETKNFFNAFDVVNMKNLAKSDVAIPIVEFADFESELLSGDDNLKIIEAYHESMGTSMHLKSFNEDGTQAIFESEGNVIYANIRKESVSKVHDFLSSF